MQSYFEHFVVAGGWAMLLLVPASMVALASFFRALLAYRWVAVAGGQQSKAAEVVARLSDLRSRHGNLSAEDIRAEIRTGVNDLYALLQPLIAVFVAAPLVGIVGSITLLMAANLDVASGGGVDRLAANYERALVPLLWGTAISALSYLGYAVLKARLYHCERNLLTPAVEEGVSSFATPRKFAARKSGRDVPLETRSPDGESSAESDTPA